MEKSQERMEASKCRSCRILSTILLEDHIGFRFHDRLIHAKLEVTSLEREAKLHRSESRHGSVALLTEHTMGYWAQPYAALLAPGTEPEINKIPLLIKNFSWMRNAISECRQRHKSCINAVPSLPELQVIDCLVSSCNISLVSVHDACQYAALSYVWGGTHATTVKVPAVIKDAIRVTVELGLKYLWVDKYCISQNDAEKHRLIRSMDKVYNAACVTIVAAAGKTSDDGLPGISTVLRMAQMEIQIDGYTLFELQTALDSAQASNLDSRGWTYQEGILSTRCLVFTDRGVFYNCRERYIDESLQQLVSPEAAVSMEEYKFLPTLFATTRTDFSQLRNRIVQYTERQLSYPQDSLDAFLGIFADYEQQIPGQFWLPRPEVPSVLSSPSDTSPLPSHIWGLPLQLGASMLEWYHPKPPKQRRPNFPSWSWTGWEGVVEFGVRSWVETSSSTDPTFAPTSIEMPNQLKGMHDRKDKCLYVTGATLELKFATQDQTRRIMEGMKQPPDTKKIPNYDVQTPRHHCLLEVLPGVFVSVRATMSAKPAPQDQIIGLLITVIANERFGARSIIVLKQCGQSFTRMGFIDAYDFWKHKFKPKLINTEGTSAGEKMLHSDILLKYKFVDINGAFIGKKMLSLLLKDRLSFGRDFIRQRICLE
ncbi:hypothetical protein ACHAPQ_011725 [Fusarium lateritium]